MNRDFFWWGYYLEYLQVSWKNWGGWDLHSPGWLSSDPHSTAAYYWVWYGASGTCRLSIFWELQVRMGRIGLFIFFHLQPWWLPCGLSSPGFMLTAIAYYCVNYCISVQRDSWLFSVLHPYQDSMNRFGISFTLCCCGYWSGWFIINMAKTWFGRAPYKLLNLK